MLNLLAFIVLVLSATAGVLAAGLFLLTRGTDWGNRYAHILGRTLLISIVLVLFSYVCVGLTYSPPSTKVVEQCKTTV